MLFNLICTHVQTNMHKKLKRVFMALCAHNCFIIRGSHALDHMVLTRDFYSVSNKVMFIMKKIWALTFFQGGDVGYILYNDQPPQQKHFEGASSTCGHTKGAVLLQLTA